MLGQLQWTGAGSALATLMFLWAVFRQYFPFSVDRYVTKHVHRLFGRVYPYLQLRIAEISGERMKHNEAYAAVDSYLSTTCSQRASRLRVEFSDDSNNPTLSMDDSQEVVDEFESVRLWWSSVKEARKVQGVSFLPVEDYKRSYVLTFHRRHRDLVINTYLPHVMRQGHEVRISNRKRKLYTNMNRGNGHGSRSTWSHVVFEHPSTFDTIAMDPVKKKELISDLETFRNAKKYYAKIGKAWKRGYLLYGPPGTGKSTMIAAIANFMEYDIYDLELTSVQNNTELRKLFIETTSKSIIVIEDIDCSLDLTGKRKPKEKKTDDRDEDQTRPPLPPEESGKEQSKVTLSGLLNFIDGLWSACGGERLIIFTTNHLEKLDPALIRTGRMDKHIEMTYCGFEAFKVLSTNYLGPADPAEPDHHELFDEVRALLGEVKITPADVAENLMPKSAHEDAKTSLRRLIDALKTAKEEAAKNADSDDKNAIEKSTVEEDDEQKSEEKQSDLKIKEEDESTGKAAAENKSGEFKVDGSANSVVD